MSARLGVWSFALTTLLACSSSGPRTPPPPVPFAVTGDRLGVFDGQSYRPLFVKGVNLGVAVPGTLAGELAATREQYDRWFEQMGELGVNAVRIYTLHYPRFYDALLQYNHRHPNAPLYVLHGIWLDDQNASLDFYDMTSAFDADIREVVNCVHANCRIAERQGRAFGDYQSDISPYVLGWVIGREMSPRELSTTDAAHADHTSYIGKAIQLPEGNPTEAWLAERLDGLVLYERGQYGQERPVSVANWPTLDPLHHASERMGSGEDTESIDLENIDTHAAPAGYFASYHAYSYFPDFMTEDPAYADATDRDGPNTYFGYLQALKAHYATHPLLIAEFGVPTSWGNAHFGAAGMNHGGETELEQGQDAVRQIYDALDANCAGGAFFAWIDEWWKRTWIVDDLAFPREDYPIWHNITSPEQNFGLIAFDLDEPTYERWPEVNGPARLTSVRADEDAEFFHVRIVLDRPLDDGERLTIGFDTYADDLGESVLPGGIHTQNRNEFALTFDAPDQAQLYVTQPYDLFGIWHGVSSDAQLYHSVASEAGNWVKVRWLNNIEFDTGGPDGGNTYDIDEVGALLVTDDPASKDKRTGVIVDGDTVHVRIPWTLLQFTDPSTSTVMDDDRSTPDTETRVSEGIRLSVALGDELVETDRYGWPDWTTVPPTAERTKSSFEIFASGLHDLP